MFSVAVCEQAVRRMVCVQAAKRGGGPLLLKGVDSFVHGQSHHKCTCNSLFPVSNSPNSHSYPVKSLPTF